MKKFKVILQIITKIASIIMIICCMIYGGKYLMFGNNINDGIKCLIFGMLSSWDDVIDIKRVILKID